MINTITTTIVNKIRIIKTKLFNHKFKKYIIDYNEKGDKLEIINSSNEHKYINNNIANKTKIIEIIKDHKEEINLKISYYENKKEEYKIMLLFNECILILLGFIFLFSFFMGETLFFLLALLIFGIYLLIFINYTHRILIFREEINLLKSLNKNNEYNLEYINIKNIIDNTKYSLNNIKFNNILKNNSEILDK